MQYLEEQAVRGARTIGRRAVALVGLVVVAGACYRSVPITAATPGITTSFALTDAGRVALGPRIGEGARKLEGVVESIADSGFVLRMRSVTYLTGSSNPWTGERLVVGREYVTDVRERRFSRSRTFAAAAASIGGVVAFIVTRQIIGRGSDADKPGGGGPTEQ